MTQNERIGAPGCPLALPIVIMVLLGSFVLLSFHLSRSQAHAAGADQTKIRRISTQYIAALGDPGATSGSGAQSWGLWPLDPGPRGVKLTHYQRLKDAGGLAPAGWQFHSTDWWLEEHGLLMEQPTFPLTPRPIPRHGRPRCHGGADHSSRRQKR